MTKAEFNAKYDERYSSFKRFIVDNNYFTERLKELSDDVDNSSYDEVLASIVVCLLDLNADFLRSVLLDSFEFDD